MTARRDITIPIRLVARLELSPSASLAYWIDPLPGQEPRTQPGQVMTNLPPIAFEQVTLYANRNSALRVADLRIGRDWREVIPAR
jgi:hypothetical protein